VFWPSFCFEKGRRSGKKEKEKKDFSSGSAANFKFLAS